VERRKGRVLSAGRDDVLNAWEGQAAPGGLATKQPSTAFCSHSTPLKQACSLVCPSACRTARLSPRPPRPPVPLPTCRRLCIPPAGLASPPPSPAAPAPPRQSPAGIEQKANKQSRQSELRHVRVRHGRIEHVGQRPLSTLHRRFTHRLVQQHVVEHQAQSLTAQRPTTRPCRPTHRAAPPTVWCSSTWLSTDPSAYLAPSSLAATSTASLQGVSRGGG